MKAKDKKVQKELKALKRLQVYYDFLKESLREDVKPKELLEDIGATSWEYAYQKMGGDEAVIDPAEGDTAPKYLAYKNAFNRIFSIAYSDLTDIWRDLE